MCADMPMSEVITFREMPTYSLPYGRVTTVIGAPAVISALYTVAKPPETPITLPQPLPIAPLLPIQNSPPSAPTGRATTAPTTIRGQERTMSGLADTLNTPPPLASGPVAEGTIDPKLIESVTLPDTDLDGLSGTFPSDKSATTVPSGTQPADSLNNGVLVLATIFTTLGLIYMAVIAYDYHQRWMHSLTVQNDRYLVGGAFDMEMDDMYGSSRSFSDGIGLSDGLGLRRPI
jgi:hypothetical protein